MAVRRVRETYYTPEDDVASVLAGMPDRAQHSIDVEIYALTFHGAIDHLKQIVIDGTLGPLADGSLVGYGSFNFSASAAKQDNVWVVSNDPGEVAYALDKFERDWATNPADPAWQILPEAAG